jgi:hypothetical protein
VKIKGELFSTDMVKAFLDNRKSRTNRPIKDGITVLEKEKMYVRSYAELVDPKVLNDANGNFFFTQQHPEGGYTFTIECKPMYQPGDIMYVRETWAKIEDFKNYADVEIEDGLKYLFKCDDDGKEHTFVDAGVQRWHPSIHMPREAARLWFRVSDVKVQNIADMTEQDAEQDGFEPKDFFVAKGKICGTQCTALESFKQFWAKQYGVDANWMWVYYLEKISREEALKDESAEN